MNLLMKEGDGEVVSGYPEYVHVDVRMTVTPDVCCHSNFPSPARNLFVVNRLSCFSFLRWHLLT
jgi:hypothetical protein